jgi:hypothetical protein
VRECHSALPQGSRCQCSPRAIGDMATRGTTGSAARASRISSLVGIQGHGGPPDFPIGDPIDRSAQLVNRQVFGMRQCHGGRVAL